jgi:hypothetical protein
MFQCYRAHPVPRVGVLGLPAIGRLMTPRTVPMPWLEGIGEGTRQTCLGRQRHPCNAEEIQVLPWTLTLISADLGVGSAAQSVTYDEYAPCLRCSPP